MSEQLDLLGAGAPRVSEGERWARAQGFRLVVGLDEVGRGPLAGPVVAAAVHVPQGVEAALIAAGVDDSKALREAKREAVAGLLRDQTLWALGEASPAEIDEINILQASFLAMRRALEALLPQLPGAVDCLLVDGNRPLPQAPVPARQRALVKGDSRSVAIAAASILAKVHRDGLMVAFDAQYPGYGLAKHKGYPSKPHKAAILALGPSPIHRMSFRGVRPESSQ